MIKKILTTLWKDIKCMNDKHDYEIFKEEEFDSVYGPANSHIYKCKNCGKEYSGTTISLGTFKWKTNENNK